MLSGALGTPRPGALLSQPRARSDTSRQNDAIPPVNLWTQAGAGLKVSVAYKVITKKCLCDNNKLDDTVFFRGYHTVSSLILGCAPEKFTDLPHILLYFDTAIN